VSASTRVRATTGLTFGAVFVALVAVFAADASLPPGYGAYFYAIPVFAIGVTRKIWAVITTGSLALALAALALVFKVSHDGGAAAALIAFNRVGAAVLIVFAAVTAVALISRDLRAQRLAISVALLVDQREADRQLLAAASAISPIGTWSYVLNTDGRITWSDEVATLHGENPGSHPMLDDVLAHYPKPEGDHLRAAIAESSATGKPFFEDTTLVGTDGIERHVLVMGQAVRDAVGVVTALHGLVQDITPWRDAETIVERQRERFNKLTASLPLQLWTATPDGDVDYYSDGSLHPLDMPHQGMLGSGWLEVIHPDDKDGVVRAWNRAVATGKTFSRRYRARVSDGTYRWLYVSAAPERDESGTIAAWWGSGVDVHDAHIERERADALMTERQTVLELIIDGAVSLDDQWHVLFANTAAMAASNLPRGQVLGSTLWEVVPWFAEPAVAPALRRAMELHVQERVIYHSEDTDAWFDISAVPTLTGLTVSFRDVTPMHRLTEQLARAQRLESVGQLTGGIAHDFNNLLTVVLGGSDALLVDRRLGDEARETASLVKEAALRGAELTNRLLAFARRQALEPRPVDLSRRFTAVLPLIERTIGENIEIKTDIEENLPAAHVDPGQLEHALINLAVNARDAMPGGGVLSLGAARATLRESLITSHGEVMPGDYVTVTVTDTGTGVAPGDLEHVFDPFFTTKPEGKGSGLGLAMVWGFVQQSGGRITVHSEPGLGSTFRMYFPAAASAAENDTSSPPEDVLTERGVGHILLVDDDPLVRQFASMQLRGHGYTVTVASSGPEALSLVETLDRPDLLFTDMIMPGGMTGKDLADAVRGRWPDLPVLFTSGYAQDAMIGANRMDKGATLLAKPYSAVQLLNRVHKEMTAQGDTP